MDSLGEVTRVLAWLNEAERVLQEHVGALSERARVEQELRQVVSLVAPLTTSTLMQPELLSPRRPEPMRVQVEFVVQLGQRDKERHPNE
jgi:hypothetical protein